MDNLRLIIQFEQPSVTLPVNYHNLIQGWIYSLLPADGYGSFLHNEGYRAGNRPFKLFVFSDLMGSYEIKDRRITFTNGCTLKIASQSEEFIQHLYQFLSLNQKAMIGHQILHIRSLRLEELPWFKGEKEVVLRSISPVTAYSTDDRQVTYYQPGTEDFELSCLNNLKNKCIAYSLNFAPDFEITDVEYAKKRIIHFKNTFYVSYNVMLRIRTDYPTLNLIWNTGLCAKNSAGFGMVDILSPQQDVTDHE